MMMMVVVVVGRPLLPEILGRTNRVGGEFRSIFARSASVVTNLES